jgi:hypothetical protein
VGIWIELVTGRVERFYVVFEERLKEETMSYLDAGM